MGNAWNPAYKNPMMNFLTELGEIQAKMAGIKLKQTGLKFDTMITSELTRSRHTLSIIAHTVQDWQREFIVDGRFNERASADMTKGPLERESTKEEHFGKVEDGLHHLVLPHLEKQNILLVSHYYTMQAIFKVLGVNRSRMWGHGDHIPNSIPYIWDPREPEKMLVLNDETRVPKY